MSKKLKAKEIQFIIDKRIEELRERHNILKEIQLNEPEHNTGTQLQRGFLMEHLTQRIEEASIIRNLITNAERDKSLL